MALKELNKIEGKQSKEKTFLWFIIVSSGIIEFLRSHVKNSAWFSEILKAYQLKNCFYYLVKLRFT